MAVKGSIPQSGHTGPLLPPPGSLPTFPLGSACPYRKWEPHAGDHCREAPKQDHCTATRKVLAPTQVPAREWATLRKSGSNRTSRLAGAGRVGTLWRTPTPLSSLLFQPHFPHLIRLQPSPSCREEFGGGGFCCCFLGFMGFFFTSTYTIIQSVTCHTCLNGIILCALFSLGIWPSFFSFPFCKSLLSPRVDS